MTNRSFRRLGMRLFASAAVSTLFLSVPAVTPLQSAAHAQAGPQQGGPMDAEDFHEALDGYGQWQPHPRWGEVWVPANRPADWRPYQVGHWVYTDDWGWYWISDGEEQDWGWVTYHYGRWVLDRGLGWVWVGGDEWAPAWVNWRRGDNYVGWAPQPPEEILYDVDDQPDYWMFVRPQELIAPRLVFLPFAQRPEYLRDTVIVNRTVAFNDPRRRFAVNPGIPAAFIAAAAHRAIPTFRVRPRVFARTQGVQGAVVVRAADLRGNRPGARPGGPNRAAITQTQVTRTTTTIQPARTVAPPQALPRNEPGRFGPNAPRAAQGARPAAPTALGVRPGAGPNNAQPQQNGAAPRTATPPTTPPTTPPPAANTPNRPNTNTPNVVRPGVTPQAPSPSPQFNRPAARPATPPGAPAMRPGNVPPQRTAPPQRPVPPPQQRAAPPHPAPAARPAPPRPAPAARPAPPRPAPAARPAPPRPAPAARPAPARPAAKPAPAKPQEPPK